MKLRRNKKGFTIIELVIVIAVIGILAAVLIPTFVNLTNKANEASDNALINNLNKALAIEEQEPGHKKSQTLEGAILDLENQGYLLENLAMKSGKELLWSQSENRFLEKPEGKSGKDFWKIVDAVPAKADQKYSYYAGKNFNQTNVTVAYGFDAGRNDGIAKVTYEGTGSAQEVAIRTKGDKATLIVNAPTDEVHHYSYLDELTVQAVANSSYYEHGTIRTKATISQGHISIENGASVPTVSVENVPADKVVKVTANEPTIIHADAASSSKTSVVANSHEIYVDGIDSSKISGKTAESVKVPEAVNTEADLKTAFTNGGFVKLNADIALTTASKQYTRKHDTSFTENVVVDTNKAVLLDLNGHSITAGNELGDDIDFFAIDDNGSLKVCDNSAEGNGQIIANAKMFYVRGSLEIVNGTYLTTVLCSGTDFRSMIITDAKSNLILDDGLFYTPKCVLTSWADSVIVNGGTYVCASCTYWDSVPQSKNTTSWAYILRLGEGKNVINGGTYYGIQGGISLEGGESVIKYATVNVSGEALAKFSEFTNGKVKIHPLDKKADEFYVTTELVNTYKNNFNSNSHYAVYVAGEENVVYGTIESGNYTTGYLYAVYIGNNNDGGKGFYAHCTINGGNFVAPEGKAAVYETGLNIAYGAGYTEIFGGEFSTNVTPLMKDTSHYMCRQNSHGMWEVVTK